MVNEKINIAAKPLFSYEQAGDIASAIPTIRF